MDYKLAETWYRAASEQGCAFGTENLGQLYERGLGVSEDPAEACRLYGLAAEKGWVVAQDRFAYCLWHGQGFPHESIRALAWYRVSAGGYPAESPSRKRVEHQCQRIEAELAPDDIKSATALAGEIGSRLATLPEPDLCAHPTTCTCGAPHHP